MASRNANALRRFCLVYFGVDQTTSIVETKKLRNKENGKLYSDSAPEKGFSVTVEHCRKMLDAMVISSDGKLFACLFFILRELLCNCTLKYFPFFFSIELKRLILFFLHMQIIKASFAKRKRYSSTIQQTPIFSKRSSLEREQGKRRIQSETQLKTSRKTTEMRY